MDTQTPIIHLLILLKNAVNLLIFNSFVRLLAMENATISIVIGKTTVCIMDTIVVAKNPTAGLQIAAETEPPLAASNVSNSGKIKDICVRIAETQRKQDAKHSVTIAKIGINTPA